MLSKKRTSQAAAATDLIFEVFRLHGRLIALGDRMVAPFGLTSARWQILGAVRETGQDMTVPMIARHLGLSRQAVQRVVNELVRDGLIRLIANPHHKRAKLVRLTDRGADAYARADAAFFTWANAAMGDLDAANVKAARDVAAALRRLCEAYLDDAADDQPPRPSPRS